MGYITDYNGTIKLSSKEIEKKLEEFIKANGEGWDEYFDLEGIEVCETRVRLNGYGKLYSEQLHKFCLFIAKIDRESFGKIECKGEDSDDLWRIVVSEGEIAINVGYISYSDEDEKFDSKDINKDIYAITKDKTLLKELIVEELEDG